MKLHVIYLSDELALRNPMICVRSLRELPIYAQDLVKQLTAPANMEVWVAR